ncbi:hypothetical protein IGW14_05300 [Streptomyces hygroscopicus subsp. hygroscopicus]|uniref:hypothetical protein n=1 Tax=Streptomyces hygroscopicus TaxID=1912 RepID=UPI0007677D63|nr:hypothetical protein [Streptomyces hygroscopicus]MBW8087474.1 hypothetical protein [Streptomyces hygroscopicus subsp. hygroscopicus]
MCVRWPTRIQISALPEPTEPPASDRPCRTTRTTGGFWDVRQLDDRWQLALALDGLANALLGSGGSGAVGEARRLWEEASSVLAGYDDARAVGLRAPVGDALATSRG